MHIVWKNLKSNTRFKRSYFEEAVIPGNLQTLLFTIGAKDKIDKNSRCTISKSHYHGNSLSLFNFLLLWTLEKKDIIRDMLKFHQQTVERWENYLPFIRNLKRTKILLEYFFTSFNSKHSRYEANATVLPYERKKKFDWLKHVASLSEFVPGTSWSVYNARRNKADIVPYFNSFFYHNLT